MIDDIIPFYRPSDRLITKSKDCYLYDSKGKEYIDFESGVWCANIGHSNDQIVKVLNNQVDISIHHGYKFRNQFAENLSVKLQRLIGFKNGSSVFLSSGSEAVNLSITLSRHLSGRKKILKIDNSFLSSYGFGQISDENDEMVTVKYNNIDSIANIDFTEIAAFVVETGGASVEMVRFPDSDFINHLIKKSVRNDCMIIANEVTTGMGRMGKWFGFQHYDFIPDIVVTGKGLGNGYPVSAITINSNISDRYNQNSFRYAQSHQNDPLGCAVGLEVIKFIEEKDLIENSRKVGAYFKDQLERLNKNYTDKLKEVRARGLMLALEFTNDYNGAFLSNQLFEAGFVTGYKLNTLRFLPPLTINELHIDKLINEIDRLLSK